MPAAIQHMSDGLGARLDCAESGYGGHAIQEGRYVYAVYPVYPYQYLNIHDVSPHRRSQGLAANIDQMVS